MRGDFNYPIVIASSFFNNENFGYYGTIDQGIPRMVGPDERSGRVSLPNSATIRTPEPGNIDRGTIQSWNVSAERRLPWNVGLDVAYVGAKGDGGYGDLDINAPAVIGSGNAGGPYASFGRFIAVNLWGERLKTRYHSLQVAVNRPLTNGLLLKGAYTWGKAMNMGDEDGRVTLNYNTSSQYSRNYALAGFDRKHNFQLGFLYQLPWRSDKGSGGIVRMLAGDWQVNGVLGVFSGAPFTVTANGATLNTPSNQQTGQEVKQPTLIGAVGASGTYYDSSAWQTPQGVRFGNSGRNPYRGPGGANLDLSLFRGFPLGGVRRLEFRAEAFNVTNTPTFANPNGDMTSGTFMRITGTQSGYAERQVRLGLRFAF